MEEINTDKFYWKDGRLLPRKPPRRRDHLQFTCHDFSFKFLQKQLNKREHLYLVASDNGLVLCSTTKRFQMDYFVCNPLTKKWVALPRPINCHEWILNGFICELETDASSSCSIVNPTVVYKVVRIMVPSERKSTNLDIEVFSSESGKWNHYVVACPRPILQGNQWRNPGQSYNGVITNNGVLYWIKSTSRIVAYHHNRTGAGHCELINLPSDIKPSEQGRFAIWSILGSFGGFIGYCESCRGPLDEFSLSVWLLDVDSGRCHLNGTSAWHLVHKIDPSDMIKRLEGPYNRGPLLPLAFHPANPHIIILDSYGCIVACDIKTEGFEIVLRRLPQIYFEYEGTFRWRYRVLPFVLTSRPTTVPPPSWSEPFNFAV